MKNHSSLRCFFLLILAWVAAGCSPNGAHDSDTTHSPNGAQDNGTTVPNFDAWDVVKISGQWAGYIHATCQVADESGRKVAKINQLTKISLQRFGEETKMEMDYRDTETLDGALIDFELVIKQGSVPMRTTGKVVGKHLEVQIESQNQKQSHSVDWPVGAGGLMGPEISLRTKPMKPGEHRKIECLNIDNQPCTAEMTADKEETADLPGSALKLLKIDMIERMSPDSQGHRLEVPGAAWTNADGDVVKTWIKPMNMETCRVTQEVALAAPAAKFDLGEATLVKVDRAISNANSAKQVRYWVHLEDGDPAAAFPSGPVQAVKRIDDHTAEVMVKAVRPASGGQPADKANDAKGDKTAADLPTEADLASNNFIQSDDPLIVEQAKKAAGDEKDPWKVAVALETYVHGAVTSKDYSQAMATAAEVARNHEGDCKGHALYLAALARARKIPARVVAGLVYVPKAQAFAGHMWTEVYVGGKWIGLDGTLAQGGIGGGHLQVAHSPMAGAAAYNILFPVMQVVGRLKIEVIDSE